MSVEQWLKSATQKLKSAGIATARLDCLVLLEDVTGKERSWLLAHPEAVISNENGSILAVMIKKRAAHQPLAYVRGRTEFYGREFAITEAVLEPRPESETMIDLLKELRPSGTIIDVGTGSGALGITAALELPHTTVELLDIDETALAIARKNMKSHGLELKTYISNLLENAMNADVLLANLPYVPDSHALNEAAMNEPPIAIFGGTDGLDLYRRLFQQIANNSQFMEYILTESLPFQQEQLQTIAKKAGYRLVKSDDFIQVYKSH